VFRLLAPPTPIPGAWTAIASSVSTEAPRNHDVFQDGRFVVVLDREPGTATVGREPITMRVIYNWLTELD
jgi:hypothetical protein